jgi:hypothetical protein
MAVMSLNVAYYGLVLLALSASLESSLKAPASITSSDVINLNLYISIITENGFVSHHSRNRVYTGSCLYWLASTNSILVLQLVFFALAFTAQLHEETSSFLRLLSAYLFNSLVLPLTVVMFSTPGFNGINHHLHSLSVLPYFSSVFFSLATSGSHSPLMISCDC